MNRESARRALHATLAAVLCLACASDAAAQWQTRDPGTWGARRQPVRLDRYAAAR